MFDSPRYSKAKEKAAIVAAFAFIQACCLTSAQDFTTRYAISNPFGVNGPLPFGKPLDLGVGKGFKGGIGVGIGLQSTYDSNFFQTEHDEESELSTAILPHLNYSTDSEGGATVSISAGYQPAIRNYLQNPDLNGVDQSGNVSIIISGSKTLISAYAGYTQESGTDRLVGEFVTGSALSLGLQGAYQLAPRTSIYANWSTSISDYGTSSVVGFDNYSVNLGGTWAATERFRFGPSIGFSTTNSDNTGTQDSWNFSMNTTYAANELIRLAASLGLQFSQNSRESESANTNLTGSLSASYKINELWSWSNSIQSGIIPSPTQTNYVINNWSISSILNRQLLIGSAGIGVDYYISDYERVGTAGASQGADDNIGILLSFQRPFFTDRIGFNTSLRYSINSGQNEWSQLQLNTGLSMEF